VSLGNTSWFTLDLVPAFAMPQLSGQWVQQNQTLKSIFTTASGFEDDW
jgi:hypothetical protein